MATFTLTASKHYISYFQHSPRAHPSQLAVLDEERCGVQRQGPTGDLPGEREGGPRVHQQAVHLPRLPGRLRQLLLCLGYLQA